jgi:hypothetical protein
VLLGPPHLDLLNVSINGVPHAKGVHKKNLAGYIAGCELRRNLKRISPPFIAELVAYHPFDT